MWLDISFVGIGIIVGNEGELLDVPIRPSTPFLSHPHLPISLMSSEAMRPLSVPVQWFCSGSKLSLSSSFFYSPASSPSPPLQLENAQARIQYLSFNWCSTARERGWRLYLLGSWDLYRDFFPHAQHTHKQGVVTLSSLLES